MAITFTVEITLYDTEDANVALKDLDYAIGNLRVRDQDEELYVLTYDIVGVDDEEEDSPITQALADAEAETAEEQAAIMQHTSAKLYNQENDR